MSRWADMSATSRQEACLDGRKAGHSAQQTADQCQTSRNSVIGYLKRMKDSGVTVPASPHGKRRNKVAAAKQPTAKPTPPKSPPKVNGGALVQQIRARMAAPDHPVISRERAFGPIPGTTPLPLLECGPRNCRFPVDGLHGPSLLFCAAPKDIEVSFCPAHQRLAYQPARERIRRDRIATATMRRVA